MDMNEKLDGEIIINNIYQNLLTQEKSDTLIKRFIKIPINIKFQLQTQ